MRIATLVAVLSSIVFGVSGTVAYPQNAGPTSSAEVQKSEASQASRSLLADSEVDTNYVIGPEDVLDVDVFDYLELSKTVRVANDGNVGLPLLGQVHAAGYTTQQFRKDVESKYSQTYLKDPQITVAVREFHARPVSVIGSVSKPGLFQLTGPRKLIEVLSMAGGPTREAGRTVLVTRAAGFGALGQVEGMHELSADQVEINMRQLLYSHEEKLNIEIMPLDTIAVNKADIIYVVGAVKLATGFALSEREHVTVLQALALAGGLDGGAAKKSTRIFRTRADGSREEIPLDLGKVLKGQSQDLELVANDILFVPKSTGKDVGKRGAEAAVGVVGQLIIYGRL